MQSLVNLGLGLVEQDPEFGMVDRDDTMVDTALFVIERAAEMNPNSPFCHIAKSMALAQLERYEESMEELRKMRDIIPNTTTSNAYFLELWQKLSHEDDDPFETKEKEDTFLEAMNQDPRNSIFYKDIVNWLPPLPKYNKIRRRFLEQIIKLEPHDIDARLDLALTHRG